MASVAWMTLACVCAAGLIGLHLCRLALRSPTHGVDHLAAVGLMQALEKFGPASGASPTSLDRVRASCVCTITRGTGNLPVPFLGSRIQPLRPRRLATSIERAAQP